MQTQKMNEPFLFLKSVMSTDRLLLELPAMMQCLQWSSGNGNQYFCTRQDNQVQFLLTIIVFNNETELYKNFAYQGFNFMLFSGTCFKCFF